MGFFKSGISLRALRRFTDVFDVDFNGLHFFDWLFAGHND
jgi:hypothetical protein